MKRIIPAKKAGFYQREDYIWPAEIDDYRFKYDHDNKTITSKASATIYYNKQYESFYFDSDADALAFAEQIKGKIDLIEINASR